MLLFLAIHRKKNQSVNLILWVRLNFKHDEKKDVSFLQNDSLF